MTQIIIRNSYVYDPVNNINGEIMDICVENDKIIDCKEINDKKATIINAKNKVLMPGGIDIHTHIAGPKINVARLMRPEDHYITNIPGFPEITRAQTGKTVPTVIRTGYRYALMGYTLVCEAATPPLKTRHTHEELNSTPIIDKLAYVLMDSNWLGLDYIANNDIDNLAAYTAWLLYTTKCYTVKLVDPGADVAWIYGKGEGLDLNDQIPEYGLTPREIIHHYGKVGEILKLPHTLHIHTNRLGIPGNYTTIVGTMRIAPGYALSDRYVMHIAHAQFTGYKGDSWSTFESGSDEIVKELDNNPNVSLDLGQIVFGMTTTMTSDAPFEFALYHLQPWKAALHDIEAETAAGIVPYSYRRRSLVNTIQWAIGLEIALMTKNIWRIVLSTDHPNAAPFTKYPEIMTWLMSRKAREEIMKKVNNRALRRIILPTIDKEYSLYEICIITRTAPAKILGLERIKGCLSIGADADVAIYDIDPKSIDFSRDYEKIKKLLSRSWCTIKNGEIVVMDGKVVKTIYGKTYYVKPIVNEELMRNVENDIKKKFRTYYSISPKNFIVGKDELRKSEEIELAVK